MPCYIKLNSSDVAESLTQTHSALASSADLVEVDGFLEGVLGKQYDRQASTPGAPVFVDLPLPLATAPVWAWFIDHGPFADRLGATATMTIDVSADPGFVAIRADFARRKWIDLKDPRVAATVNYLAGQPLPVLGALATPLITPERAAQILAAKPELTENLALRKLYFNA